MRVCVYFYLGFSIVCLGGLRTYLHVCAGVCYMLSYAEPRLDQVEEGQGDASGSELISGSVEVLTVTTGWESS